MAESISVQLEKIMKAYGDRVKDAYNVSVNRVSREAVTRLRNTSPKRKGEYARGWTLKRIRARGGLTDVIVHNKVYQLTHLLEKGHLIRNKYGEYGRAPAYPHIKPVEEWANDELPNEIERELE